MNMEKVATAAAATTTAATTNGAATTTSTIPLNKRLKRCEFKGCKKTSNECEIVNHGCPIHHSFMKEKNTKQRIANYAKKKAILRKQFDFTSCSKLVNNYDFMKYDSYKTDVIKVAAVNKGKLIALTTGEKTPYMSLKKHGVAFVDDGIQIDETAYEDFLKIIETKKSKFKPLFTAINKNGTPKFIMEKGPNRYSIGGDDSDIEEWNNVHIQFKRLANNLKLPTKGNAMKRQAMHINVDFNIIKSDSGLTQGQQAHTDELHSFSLGNTTKFFNFVTLTGIEKETLFYIQPIGMDPNQF